MKALNARQEEILAWIGDGCPKHDWPDYTHRTTARALQTQGLVKVRGHGTNWTAAITDVGRAVLAGNVSKQAPVRSRALVSARRGVAGRAVPSPDHPDAQVWAVSAEQLVERLTSAGGILRIAAPLPTERAAYRRALAGVGTDLLPEGKRIRHKGRDRGDMVIELIDRSEDPGPDRQPIPVPEALDLASPVIQHLAGHPELLGVSEASLERALLLIQALGEECRRRGYATAYRGQEQGFDLVIESERVTVLVSEEQEKASRVPPDELAKVKYDWQRARAVVVEEWSGRLVMTLQTGGWNPPRWADRKRWTLDSRLPLLLERAEEAARACKEARAKADQERAERHQLWEESIPLAKEAYIDDLNRKRLAKQLEAHSQAQVRRAYADAVARAVSDLEPGQQREAAEAWAAWIRSEADRLDTALDLERLHYVTPDDLPAWDVSKYMPNGWSISWPPD